MNHIDELPERVRLRLNVSDVGCWLWQGHTVKGYGALRSNGRQIYVHRFTYEALVAPIPVGLEIDHLCRVKNCANPDHLEPVTPAENKRRCRLEFCAKGHSMADAYISVPKDGGRDRRRCRPCTREYQAAQKPDRRVAQCGTKSGYQRHHRLSEGPCAECSEAQREYDRARRAAKRAAAAGTSWSPRAGGDLACQCAGCVEAAA